MKFQRIPVLALATLLVTAGACGGQQVLETKGAPEVASAYDGFRAANAFEERVNAAVKGPQHLGSADAIEHRVAVASKYVGSADAVEHRTSEPRRLTDAQAKQQLQAQAYVDHLNAMTPEQLAAAFGSGRTLPNPSATIQGQAKAYADAIQKMTNEAKALGLGIIEPGAGVALQP
jgi:hypothetical protein